MSLRATSTLFPAGSAFSLNGVHSDTWQAYLRGWSIGLLPTPRGGLVDIPGGVGKADTGTELSSRLLSLDLSVFEPDRPRLHALLRAFAAALDPRAGPHRFELVDEFPDWYVLGVPTTDSQVQPSNAAVTGAFSVTLELADPHFYAAAAQSVAHRFTATGDTTTLDNLGSTETPLRISVSPRSGAPGPLTGFTITVGGVAIVYTGALASGDTVVVDTAQMTVEKNGVNDLPHWGGDFPPLPAGTTTIGWADPGGVGAQTVFDYRERLL